MTYEVRALSICYRLLSRIDRRAQIAAVDYLKARLESDHAKILDRRRTSKIVWRGQVRRAGGEALLSLIEMIQVTGAKRGRRTIDISGEQIAAHAVVNVEKVEAP